MFQYLAPLLFVNAGKTVRTTTTLANGPVYQLRRSPQRSLRGQYGTAVVLLLTLLALTASAALYGRLKSNTAFNVDREVANAAALAEAKAALIASAVTAYSASKKRATPGQLPFPDRNRDGNYDGRGDCVTFALNDSHLLGRFPWVGDVSPCPRIGLNVDVRDGSGEQLWYAVSRNLVTRGGGGLVNPDMGIPGRAVHAWIVVRGADGRVISDPTTGAPVPIAAVVIAPGAALGSQDRREPAPAAAHYLDRITIGGITYDNSDADGCPDAVASPCGFPSAGEEFIVRSDARIEANFNDRLVYVTFSELMRALEKRVLGEVAVALEGYRRANGAYPWLAEFDNPERATFKSNLSRRGLLPVHLPNESFSTGFGGAWEFIDGTPTTESWHSGDAALIPPLADLQRGRIQVEAIDGRCRWSDWTRADCSGSRTILNHFRADIGIAVTRTVEYSFTLVDETPQVTAPTPASPRRRALSVSGSPLTGALSFSRHITWNVRVTDDDGVNRGRRDIRIDANTAGTVTLTGIRFDLSIVYDNRHDDRDELPEWFTQNNWHHFLYAAFSSDAVAGGDIDGDGDCTTPLNTCLTLTVDGTVARSDVRGLLVSAGFERSMQNRAVGDCDGDGVGDDFLCAYFEGDNGDTSTAARSDIYARDRYSAGFNDQVRIIEPWPP